MVMCHRTSLDWLAGFIESRFEILAEEGELALCL
jgi:hypothetical protein